MSQTLLPSTTILFGSNTFAGNFGNKTFPMSPIPLDSEAFNSSINLIDSNTNFDITLYFYTDSIIESSNILLYTEGSALYVNIDTYQNPTPINVRLWKLTATIPESTLNYSNGETIKLFCQNPGPNNDDITGIKTSRGTEVVVQD